MIDLKDKSKKNWLLPSSSEELEQFVKGTDRVLQIHNRARTSVQTMANQPTDNGLAGAFRAGKKHYPMLLLQIISEIFQNIFSPGPGKKYIGIRLRSERRVFKTKVLEIHYAML